MSTRTSALAATALAAVAGLMVGLAPTAAASTPASSGPELVVSGTVERFLVDDFGSHDAADVDAALTFVHTGDDAVQVPTSALADVPDGATVRVALQDSATAEVTDDGVEIQQSATDPEAGPTVAGVEVVAEKASGLTDTGTGAAPVVATVSAAASASHHVLVVVAIPAGGSASTVSASDVAATIRGSVSTYWSRMTGGSVTFDATAYPTVVRTASTPCVGNGDVGPSFDFWNEIQAKTGWTEGPGKHLVVYFRTLAACGGIAGLGTVGSDRSSGGVLWSNGYNTTGVLGHELGHNLSLGHSSTLTCSEDGRRTTDSGSCTKKSYLDTSDIMGVSWQNQGYLNGSHLRYLGLLSSPSAQARPTTSGRVVLQPLAGATGLRLLTLADGSTTYVLEYRTATGQDAWMGTAPGWSTLGVTVRREVAGSTAFPLRESLLLDADTSTADSGFGSLDAALPQGRWVTLADGQLRVRLVSASSAGAVVDYEIAGTPAVAQVASPVLDMSTPTASLARGTVRRTAAGPVVPVTWAWDVTTAAATTTGRAASTALATPAGTTLRRTATLTDADGTVWSSTGTALATYRSDRAPSSYVGPWTVASMTTAVDGRLHRSSTRYASVTTTVTGSGFSVLLARGARNGWVVVKVDGVRVAAVSMRAATSGVRAAYAGTFASPGTHTVTVTNMTGGTHGVLGYDGVVALG